MISRDEFKNLLTTQIEKGNEILKKEIKPTKSFGKCNSSPSGYHYEYDKDDVDAYKDLRGKWFKYTRDLFLSSFDTPMCAVNQYLKEYEDAGMDFLNLYSRNKIATQKKILKAEIEALESIRERIKFIHIYSSDVEIDNTDKHYGTDIFIVHGHNNETKQTVARTIEKLGLKAIILHEMKNKGRTIIEKLEEESANAGFAVILMTADDFGRAKTEEHEQPRARQNVIIEMGYFIGKLGRERVMTLLEEGIDKPGDTDGIVYTPIDSAGAWKFELISELQGAGFNVDAKRSPNKDA